MQYSAFGSLSLSLALALPRPAPPVCGPCHCIVLYLVVSAHEPAVGSNLAQTPLALQSQPDEHLCLKTSQAILSAGVGGLEGLQPCMLDAIKSRGFAFHPPLVVPEPGVMDKVGWPTANRRWELGSSLVWDHPTYRE